MRYESWETATWMPHSLSPLRKATMSGSDKGRARHCIWFRVNTWMASQPKLFPFPGALSTPPDVETCAPSNGILHLSHPLAGRDPTSGPGSLSLSLQAQRIPHASTPFSLAACRLFKEKDWADRGYFMPLGGGGPDEDESSPSFSVSSRQRTTIRWIGSSVLERIQTQRDCYGFPPFERA